MDYRKIIKFGHNAYVVSMPAKWLKRNKVEKGDTLFLEEVGNQIILSTQKESKQEDQVETIDVKEKDTNATISRKLISSYENNATTIIFSSNYVSKKAKMISDLVKLFTALEIIEHTKNRIVCKTYIDTTTIDIVSFIRRMDNGIKSIMKDLVEQLNKPQELKQFREDITEREKSIDKITRLLRRVIKERLYKQQQKQESALTLLRYWQAIVYIEELGDMLEEISCAPIETFSKKETGQAQCFLQQALELFEKIMPVFYQQESTKAHALADTIKKIRTEMEEKLKKEEHTIILHKISQCAYLIHEINKVSY